MDAASLPLFRHGLRVPYALLFALVLLLIAVLFASGGVPAAETSVIAHLDGRDVTPFRWG